MVEHLLLHQQNPNETIEKLGDYHFPPYITLAHLFSAPPGWEILPRSLSQYQLQYVVSGQANYHVAGHAFLTQKGDMILHRPDELHFVKMIDPLPYVCISIVFHFGPIPFPLNPLFEGKHFLGNYAEQAVEQKLIQLVTRYLQPGQSNQMLCQGLLLQVLSELAAATKSASSADSLLHRTKAKLILIRNYIADHYTEDIKYHDLVTVSGISKNYIILKFKQYFGMTPFEYMIWTRIEKAKEMAIHSNLSIGEIAARVGYSDVHTFGKMYKKKTGTSLSQFCSALVTLYPHEDE